MLGAQKEPGGSSLRLLIVLATALLSLSASCSKDQGNPNRQLETLPRVISSREFVSRLASIEPPRNADHPESLDRAARIIADALSDAGLEPEFQSLSVNGAEYRNVTALLGKGNRARVVVGAHYDVLGSQPGADDNASGVAALVGIASALATRELSADVEFVAFTLEEPPAFRTEHMGSAHHARLLARSGVEVRAMLALEMLGYYSDEIGSQSFPSRELRERFPATGNFLAVVARDAEAPLVSRLQRAMATASDLPVHILAAPDAVEGIDFSDHLNYWQAGFPAVMVTDTAFFRNPNYHQPSDRPDTLDFERLQKAIEAVTAGIVALSGAD